MLWILKGKLRFHTWQPWLTISSAGSFVLLLLWRRPCGIFLFYLFFISFFLPPVLMSLWICTINLATHVSGSSCMASCATGAYKDGFPMSFSLLGRWRVLPESLWYSLGPAQPFLLLNPKSQGHRFVCGTTAFIKKEDWGRGGLQPPHHVTFFVHQSPC